MLEKYLKIIFLLFFSYSFWETLGLSLKNIIILSLKTAEKTFWISQNFNSNPTGEQNDPLSLSMGFNEAFLQDVTLIFVKSDQCYNVSQIYNFTHSVFLQ